MSLIPEHIFKAYDIRGIYPGELDEGAAEQIGRAYASMLQSERPGKDLTVAVGSDMRISSPQLKASLIAGLRTSGVNVVDIGLVSTPTFYFAVSFYGYDGGIEVSASHNPKEYNGFKMTRQRAMPIGRDTGMAEIRRRVSENDFTTAKREGRYEVLGGVLSDELLDQTKGIELSRIKPMKIVVDAANAMGAIDIDAMVKNLPIPIELIRLNFNLDGTFPIHQPDPLQDENLRWAQDAVIKHKADLGIVPDGDGDRYFFIDNTGRPLRQEILRGIMAQIELSRHPGATVCYDIRPGRITRDMIEAVGGQAVVTQVGHSLIKKTMLEHDAIFGGESSGHYFYKFSYGTFEAPIPLVIKFLVWLSNQNQPLSDAIKPYQKYHHSGEINSKVANVAEVLERIRTKYANGEQNYLDGVTVEYPDWWFNVRGSNTEPLIRLNLEAKTMALMEEHRDEVLATIRA